MSKDENKTKKEKKSVSQKSNFIKDIVSEGKRVNWPNLKKTKQAVASVFFVILFFSFSIWLFDTSVQGFGRLVGFYRDPSVTSQSKNPVPVAPTTSVEDKVAEKNEAKEDAKAEEKKEDSSSSEKTSTEKSSTEKTEDKK